MPGTPKRRRLQAALKLRAQAQLGPDAKALDYVLSWLEQGRVLAELATDMERSMAESVSRRWLSFVMHRLAPDAPDQFAVLAYGGRGTRTHVGGGQLLMAGELVQEILSHLKGKDLAKAAVSEQFPLIRTLQYAAHFRAATARALGLG